MAGQGGSPCIPPGAGMGWDMAITPTGPAIIEGNEFLGDRSVPAGAVLPGKMWTVALLQGAAGI